MFSALFVDRKLKFKHDLAKNASPADLLELAEFDSHSAREEKTDQAMRQAAKELLEEMNCQENEK